MQKTIKYDVITQQKIKYLAEVLNKSQTTFLSELIDELFSVLGTFGSANVSYFPSVSSSYVMIQFSGRNCLINGKGQMHDFSEGENDNA
jgi:hypothetical protein